MDQTAQDRPILVGIDGTEQATRAAEFGWQEARLHSRGLLLVTAYPPYIPMSPMLPYVGFRELAYRQLPAATPSRRGAT